MEEGYECGERSKKGFHSEVQYAHKQQICENIGLDVVLSAQISYFKADNEGVKMIKRG